LKCLQKRHVLCTLVLLLLCHISLCGSEMSSYVWVSLSKFPYMAHRNYASLAGEEHFFIYGAGVVPSPLSLRPFLTCCASPA
jgi:hypothetical protein